MNRREFLKIAAIGLTIGSTSYGQIRGVEGTVHQPAKVGLEKWLAVSFTSETESNPLTSIFTGTNQLDCQDFVKDVESSIPQRFNVTKFSLDTDKLGSQDVDLQTESGPVKVNAYRTFDVRSGKEARVVIAYLGTDHGRTAVLVDRLVEFGKTFGWTKTK